MIDEDAKFDAETATARAKAVKACQGLLLALRQHEAWPDTVDPELDRDRPPIGFRAHLLPEALLVVIRPPDVAATAAPRKPGRPRSAVAAFG